MDFVRKRRRHIGMEKETQRETETETEGGREKLKGEIPRKEMQR
jgi:hypothetical protein